jgi:hypothetical protein
MYKLLTLAIIFFIATTTTVVLEVDESYLEGATSEISDVLDPYEKDSSFEEEVGFEFNFSSGILVLSSNFKSEQSPELGSKHFQRVLDAIRQSHPPQAPPQIH